MSVSSSEQMDWSKRVVGIVQAAIDSVLEKTSYPLEGSRHAPQKASGARPLSRRRPRLYSSSSPSLTLHPRPPLPSHSSSPSSSTTLVPNPHSSIPDPLSSPLPENKENMPPLADVDDAEGFMAAARALKLVQKNYISDTPHADDDDDIAIDSVSTTQDSSQAVSNIFMPAPVNGHSNGFDDNAFLSADVDVDVDVNATSDNDKDDTLVSTTAVLSPAVAVVEKNFDAMAIDSGAIRIPSENGESDEGASGRASEDREHLTTFKTWGTPTTRGKPAAQIRRIIIKGLPPSWTTPAKVLTLIHGGAVESISITASGNAHILFCDHEACKSFYAKYPNGIGLDKEGKVTVFVEMGSEVDVISSQLSFNISVGATRAVRAVGASMDLSMAELMQIASNNNRKVEKIVDSCAPGGARHIVFRFCSIDDAVRFRSMIIREEQWEQCNVQYAADPCESATGFHTD